MSDDYGLIAPYYQLISKLVFGRDLIYANQAFWKEVNNKRVLIIGGGDGVAYRDYCGNLNGEFWDLSFRMIELAQGNLKSSGLSFHTGAWQGKGQFDLVVLPFLMDSLTEVEIGEFLTQVRKSLNSEGKVIISDFFSPQTFFQKMIQHTMLFGFRILANHQRNDLPNIKEHMEAVGFGLNREIIWRKGWIRAQQYECL